MNKVKIHFQHCYGIRNLKHDFDFSASSTCAIYAPNGVMKTSFAKTFRDLSKGEESKDLMFSDRPNIRLIQDENNTDISREQVFVVEPYVEQFSSDRVSTLLANVEMKNKYDEIHKKIDKAKDDLLKKLKQLSGVKSNIEGEISKSFPGKNFFQMIEEMEQDILKEESPKFANISYNEIFNEKAISFLNTKDFRKQIHEYIKKYHELIAKSKYLKEGFNHYKAATIQKNLKDNGFFQANHSVNLYDGKLKQEITSETEFEQILLEEKTAILTDEELSKKWEEIDKKLSANTELRSLREYLFSNKEILPELENMKDFAIEIWISYLKDQRTLYENLLDEYKIGKVEIAKIIEDAKKQTTDWEKVIDIFNKRFFVPFKLKMENQDDVILKGNIPSVKFIFKDFGGDIQVDGGQLLKVLSNGEKKALYILNIIFEIEARKKESQETIFIVDDIADSFDYKNKYAIIQYLKEVSEESNFKQIILTHNFDFFRTAESRFVKYNQCLIASKSGGEIYLYPAKGIKNPFINDWKKDLGNSKKLIASIPFVRNIIEYTKGDQDSEYNLLTSLLHWKDGSEDIMLNDLKSIFENTIAGIMFPTDKLADKVLELILNEAKSCLTANVSINFEHKIILSIAIRLKAEKFMIEKINLPAFVSAISKKQTSKLFEKYIEIFPVEIETLQVLEEVLLMTPENIHLNSFMYEPILDMSDDHLRSLHNKVDALN